MVLRRGFLAAASFGAGALIAVALTRSGIEVDSAVAADAPSAIAPGQLQADVEVLKAKAVDQAHVMVSVAYHFNNMWFAAQHENWPLAQFCWNETRSHLRWAVRVIPIRKDNAGNEVKLSPILEAFENGPLKRLEQTIAEKDREAFVPAYRFALENCYACHKTSDKPYLRPQVPERPAEPTINFDPAATWPQ